MSFYILLCRLDSKHDEPLEVCSRQLMHGDTWSRMRDASLKLF